MLREQADFSQSLSDSIVSPLGTGSLVNILRYACRSAIVNQLVPYIYSKTLEEKTQEVAKNCPNIYYTYCLVLSVFSSITQSYQAKCLLQYAVFSIIVNTFYDVMGHMYFL